MPRDIQPFPTVVPYDLRFVCGPFCNFASFNNPADGPYRASSADGRVRFEGWGLSGQVDWDIGDRLVTSLLLVILPSAYFAVQTAVGAPSGQSK